MIEFNKFIEKKSLYYKEIDTKTIKIAYDAISLHISKPKAIHLIGTNGKGSTGRAIAHLLYKSGKSVGHYSSPHILEFNERLWLNGKNASNHQIEEAHKILFNLLDRDILDKLSYFEYTTLLAFVLFQDCDFLVLEAGLGGEFDATTLYDNRLLSVITPIDIDHQEFLGNRVEDIATTKLKAISKMVLLAPQIHKEVYKIAYNLAKIKSATIKEANCDRYLNDKAFIEIAKDKAYPKYLQNNIALALDALNLLGVDTKIEYLKDLELFGRFYKLKDNIYIDVGHNLLGARAIYEAIDSDIILIYNTLRDKEYKKILELLKPKIKRVEIIDINNKRAVDINELKEVLDRLDIKYRKFDNSLDESEKYLVFGSFYTVEAFLKISHSI